jgi:GalNAc-alpha-(1->4)-GalNAc-alpha-(1->3)-diNAcBac-PP-undecaprenol alpha-1,4-N-acetyl-D-galactosaminyltransferase
VTLLTRGLLARGYGITVITLFGADSDFYTLPTGATRIALGIDGDSPTLIHGLANNLHRLRILRRAIKSTAPDVVVSHIHRTNIMTILAVGRTPIPVIVVEHNDPGMNPDGRIWERLRRSTYLRARKLVSVSQGVDRQFSWLPETQRTVIHNPLALPENAPAFDKQMDTGRDWIAAMGRLTAQKGFDLLLRAFARVSANHPDWRLLIIGDGELRGELEELRNELGLAEIVSFAGLLADPSATLRNAKLFVMASRFEGFPYAALEAMACGLPAIYTDCPSGPREIIRDGIDGLLVPNGDVTALAAAMDRLLSDGAERERLARRAPEVLERFGEDKIIAQWEVLFENTAPNQLK